jgi:hypothetical protein
MENQRILVKPISNELIRFEIMRFFEDRAKGFSEQDSIEALNEIPAVTTAEIDKLTAEKKTNKIKGQSLTTSNPN